MLKYSHLSKGIQDRILLDRQNHVENQYRCQDDSAIRRMDRQSDASSLWRPAFVRDIEKIIHCPFYNRYADKTQVFSFYRHDDITRRALHVQLVSRISRNIGMVLGLNLDLIEAISLGHDIGHTPFGHAGERFLSDLLQENTGRCFNHNVHSVRVLDTLFARNLSLQTLDGILCHNGEFEQEKYQPRPLAGFKEFDEQVERCYREQAAIERLVPSTLEGCVVRICDIIAYLGKDRQDAKKANISMPPFTKGEIGVENAEIINNLTVNIIENSYGKNHLVMDEAIFHELKTAKRENYEYIYHNKKNDQLYQENIKPMFHDLYDKLLADAKSKTENSVLYKHHVQFIEDARKYYSPEENYREQEPNQIVVDYIASMTDDYFIDLYHYLFPQGRYKVEYVSYFENL
ncbi:MAG: HD domain-containing protein [Clostridiaceae bacterium]|nr:HD domain-containing protein [Clostridiaceae bacterium]